MVLIEGGYVRVFFVRDLVSFYVGFLRIRDLVKRLGLIFGGIFIVL
jgi:hypothetical protein